MKINILDKETESKVAAIMENIKLRKNGVTSDAMRASGVEYALNYGVSIMHLREIAQKYPPNKSLAEALWNIGWRETFILATFLYADDSNMKFLERMFQEANTDELYQQIAMNVLLPSDDLTAICTEYIHSDWVGARICCCYAITRYFIKNSSDVDFADEIIESLLKQNSIDNGNWSEINAIGKAFAKAGYVSNIDNAKILEYFNEKKTINRYWELAAEAVKTEFEFRS